MSGNSSTSWTSPRPSPSERLARFCKVPITYRTGRDRGTPSGEKRGVVKLEYVLADEDYETSLFQPLRSPPSPRMIFGTFTSSSLAFARVPDGPYEYE